MKHIKNSHFTEDEFLQFGVMLPGSEEKISLDEHLENCEDCRRYLASTQLESVNISLAVSLDLSMQNTASCISSDIPMYLAGNLTSEKNHSIEKHLLECSTCLNHLAKQTDNYVLEVVSTEVIEATLHRVKLAVRQRTMSNQLANIYKFDALKDQHWFGDIASEVQNLLKQTFAFPSAKFSPVFGDQTAKIFGPFGKTRYPIQFEWQTNVEADKYIVSIEGVTESFTTTATSLELTRNMLQLDGGESYMWQLDICSEDQNIDQITGFFSLINQQEADEIFVVEDCVEEIEPLEDRFLLIGEILERKKLFIDAIAFYKKSYDIEPFTGLAYRIAFCYEKLELEALKEEWNQKIKDD